MGVDIFHKELAGPETSVVLDVNSFYLELPFDVVNQKVASSFLRKYMFSWKSIGILSNHSKDNKTALYIYRLRGSIAKRFPIQLFEYGEKLLINH